MEQNDISIFNPTHFIIHEGSLPLEVQTDSVSLENGHRVEEWNSGELSAAVFPSGCSVMMLVNSRVGRASGYSTTQAESSFIDTAQITKFNTVPAGEHCTCPMLPREFISHCGPA